MKAFRFSLEPVLELRQQASDRAARDLAVVCRRRADLECEQRRIHALMQDLQDCVRKRRAAGAAAWEERGFRGAILQQEEATAECRKNLDKVREEEWSARNALSKARLALKAIERLKVRRKDRFIRECERSEDRQIQEIADMAVARRSLRVSKTALQPLLFES